MARTVCEEASICANEVPHEDEIILPLVGKVEEGPPRALVQSIGCQPELVDGTEAKGRLAPAAVLMADIMAALSDRVPRQGAELHLQPPSDRFCFAVVLGKLGYGEGDVDQGACREAADLVPLRPTSPPPALSGIAYTPSPMSTTMSTPMAVTHVCTGVAVCISLCIRRGLCAHRRGRGRGRSAGVLPHKPHEPYEAPPEPV